MLRQQRTSISEQALMLAELDARVEEAEALAADALSSLKGKEDEEERKRELIVAQACGPQIVEMLSAPDFAAALSIAELCASPAGEVEEGEDLLKCLLRLLDDSDLCVPLLKFAISNELPRNPPEAAAVSLFRTPSLAGALCSAALQVSGSAYLKASLAPLVQQIASGEADFEIDPRFLSDEDDAGVNADNLCKAVQWFVDTIVHSCRDAPPLVRALCTHIFNIAGPGQRPLARRVAGSLFVDAFICQALRDTGGCGVADAALDDKAQRVLEHVARSLSRAVDDTTSDVTSPSVFAAAAMSDFALDLPDPPPELLAVIRGNRDRLVGEGGVIDQLAGVTEFEDSSTSAADLYLAGAPAPAEEVADILALRRMLATHASTLSGMLVSQGFHAQVAQLEACLRGSSDDPAAAEADAGKLLPGSNQPAPVEHNTWTETWKGPQEDVWVEGDEEADVGMLDGEHILGEVISTPEKAAGLGAITGERGSLAQRLGIAAHADGRRAAARRKTYADGQVEAADSMPDSAPERSPASVLAAEAGRTGDRQRAHASAARLDFAAEQAAAATTQDGGGDEDGEGEGDTRLLKPRRRFTKTAAVGAGRPAGPEDASGSAEADSSPAVGMLQGAGVSLGAAGALAEEGAGESPGVLGTSAVEPEIWAGLVAGGEWSLAPSQGGKQPVLRRTQRTVTIRGRAEENEGDEEGGDSREVEHVPKPSTRTVAAQKARVGEQQECSRPGEEGRGGGEDAAGAAGAPSAEPASAAPGGVGRLYGVGAVFKRNADGFFYVKKVVSGGPADKAGVTVGSRVVSMDGERLYNRTADQLFKIVLGSEGTTLKLGLQPSGAGVRTPEQVVSVRRAFIDENFLNATAIEPLPKPAAAGGGNGASGTLGRGAWAQQQHAAATAPALAAAGGSGGEAVGIGVTFKKDGEGYYVVKKMSELGGAFASGLAVGDRVLAIDGHSMHRKSSQELSRCVLGPEGTRVTLSVRSVDGTVRDIEVKRVVEFAEPDALEGDRPQPADATALRGSGTWAAGNELDVDWEGGGTGAQGEQWDGQGEVMRLAGEPEQGIVGIGATLVRDSRGLFVVAEVAPALPGTPQGRSYSLFVGDIIVQVDGIQVRGRAGGSRSRARVRCRLARASSTLSSAMSHPGPIALACALAPPPCLRASRGSGLFRPRFQKLFCKAIVRRSCLTRRRVAAGHGEARRGGGGSDPRARGLTDRAGDGARCRRRHAHGADGSTADSARVGAAAGRRALGAGCAGGSAGSGGRRRARGPTWCAAYRSTRAAAARRRRPPLVGGGAHAGRPCGGVPAGGLERRGGHGLR